MTSVLLLGHGYIARALAKEVTTRGWVLFDNKRLCHNMTFGYLRQLIDQHEPDVVINAAAFIPPSGRVSDCDRFKNETICGNVIFPKMVTEACAQQVIPLIHISTGCLFDEAKEYNEEDTPTRGWEGYCGTYVGSKLLAERLVRYYHKTYVLRIRLPFDEIDHPRNYLRKLTTFPTVFDHVNSLTHRGDFAKAALDLFQIGAQYGIYHCVNPGTVSARTVLNELMARNIIDRMPKIEKGAVTNGAILSTKKLTDAGVKIRPIFDAMREALDNWKPCTTR